MVRVLACVLLAVLAGRAHAEEHVYVHAGDPIEYALTTAPLPEVAFGTLSAELLRRAPAAAPPPQAAPALAVFGPAAPLPLTLDVSRARVSSLRLRKTFTVGPELDRLRVLTLRVRYQDGLAATINDVEVARKNLAVDARQEALAQRTHGPEWETFYIEVAPGLLRAGENVLGLEVRPSAARLAPAIELEVAASDLGHLIRGPLVQRLGERGATITFETDLPMLGEVRYGSAASSYDRRVGDVAPVTRHALVLTGLPPGQVVHYRVTASMVPGEDGDGSPDYAFHTAPEVGEVVRFVVYGDVRGGHDIHAEVLRAVLSEAPDFVVSNGDMVQRGTDEADWQRYFSISRDLLARVPVYPVIGNHDWSSVESGQRKLDDVFALPERPDGIPAGAAWYAFDLSGVHFVILDSNRYEDDRQLAWLVADLAAARARGVRAIFAAAHHGPYSRGPHAGHPVAQAKYVPVLVRAGAAIFFSGHDHLYERGKAGGLSYIVTGGGGAPLYPTRCGAPKPACKGVDGAEIAVSTHHYVLVEVYRDFLNLCAKRPDGTPVEACVRMDLRSSDPVFLGPARPSARP